MKQIDSDAKPAAAVLGGVQVRDEDIEVQTGLNFAVIVFRAASVAILLLALVQFVMWWADRPPGGVGLGLLIGDTVRLIVFSSLLWAAGALAVLFTQTHDDMRAARILLARQTAMMRRMGINTGELPPPQEPEGHRRDEDRVGGAA